MKSKKRDKNLYITDTENTIFISTKDKFIEPAILKTRAKLAEKYDVLKGEYKRYTGLCDEACKLFKEEFYNLYGEMYKISLFQDQK